MIKVNNEEELIYNMLKAIGENPDRPGLKDTPKRVSRMWKELFRGYTEKAPVVTTFDNGYDGIVCDEMIFDNGTWASMCEHHMQPIINGKYHFAYIPNPRGKILGLSKVGRVVDYYSARLQVQERLVHQIVEYLWDSLTVEKVLTHDDSRKECVKFEPLGMGLVMDAEHLCKTLRGVKKKGSMRTTKLIGTFKDNAMARSEFLGWVNSNR
jgi:GTP cyclohydrolase I